MPSETIPDDCQMIQAYLVWPMSQEVWFDGEWAEWRDVKDFYSLHDFVIVKDFK